MPRFERVIDEFDQKIRIHGPANGFVFKSLQDYTFHLSVDEIVRKFKK